MDLDRVVDRMLAAVGDEVEMSTIGREYLRLFFADAIEEAIAEALKDARREKPEGGGE